MPTDYLPILVLFVVASAFATLAIVVPTVLGPHRPTSVKLSPYESGKIPFDNTRWRFSVHFYRTAMLFLLFDVELIFFYPWAVLLRQLKLFGLIEMGLFALLLGVGYFYAWRKGALRWD